MLSTAQQLFQQGKSKASARAKASAETSTANQVQGASFQLSAAYGQGERRNAAGLERVGLDRNYPE
jgi:hypothetical protein